MRSDRKLRINDYVRSLNYWINLNDRRVGGIVFCENSGADLQKLKDSVNNSNFILPIEYLSFEGNMRPPNVHYGYSELGILDYVMSNSELLKNFDYFIKVTGRLIFKDISKLLNKLNNDSLLAIDFRRAYKAETGPPVRARTQLILFNKNFYGKYLYKKRDDMIGKCSHIEEYFGLNFYPLKDLKGVTLRWPIECMPTGIAASTGCEYGSNHEKIKSFIRGVVRKYLPSVWL